MKNYIMRFGSGDPRTLTGLAPTMLIFVRADTGATITPPSITEALTGSGLYTFQWGTTTPMAFLADAATTSPGTSGRYVSGALDPADRADEYGTTLTAIGLSGIALGTTNVALGTTNIAIGITNLAQDVNLGTTLVAIGNSSIALGFTNFALNNLNLASSSSLVALGNTNVALGTTNVAIGLSNISLGTTNVAIGTTIEALIAASGTSSLLGVLGSVGSTFGGQFTDPIDLFGFMKRVIENLEGDQNYTKMQGQLSVLSRGSSTLLRQKSIANSVSTVIKSGL